MNREFAIHAKGLLLVATCAAGIHVSRMQVTDDYRELSTLDQVYALPSPEHLTVFSLGYRSALADLLFGQTMVAAGIHFVEKQVFENLDAHLWAIVHLEPQYRDVYYYADSLLTLSTVVMPERNYRIARDLQAQGRRLFPDDAQLWLSSGQFLAYLAPPHLPEGEDPDEWKLEGARVIQQACDIWPEREELPSACMASTVLLSKLGQVDAAIRSLERLVAIADDPEVRKKAVEKLEALSSARATQLRNRRLERLSELHRRDLPLASRGMYQLIVPPFDPWACSGRHGLDEDAECATSFAAWGQALGRGE